jgi:hypothetical protein
MICCRLAAATGSAIRVQQGDLRVQVQLVTGQPDHPRDPLSEPGQARIPGVVVDIASAASSGCVHAG